jgi:hypothetical protein
VPRRTQAVTRSSQRSVTPEKQSKPPALQTAVGQSIQYRPVFTPFITQREYLDNEATPDGVEGTSKLLGDIWPRRHYSEGLRNDTTTLPISARHASVPIPSRPVLFHPDWASIANQTLAVPGQQNFNHNPAQNSLGYPFESLSAYTCNPYHTQHFLDYSYTFPP